MTTTLPAKTWSETEYQRFVVAYAREHGWTVRVMDQRNSRGVLRAQSLDQRGWPDLAVTRAGRFAWIELKAEGEKLSALQAQRIGQLIDAGHDVWIAKPTDWPTLEVVLQ
jgi:hypothetical protein